MERSEEGNADPIGLGPTSSTVSPPDPISAPNIGLRNLINEQNDRVIPIVI